MFMRYVLPAGLSLLAVPLAGFGLWLATLPAAPTAFAPALVPQADADVMLAALKPPKRARPLVAIVEHAA